MRGLDLSVGAEVEFQGRRFRISNAAVSFGEVEGREIATGLYERLPIVELDEPREEAIATVVSDLSTIEGDDYEEARRRQQVIEALLSLPQRRTEDVKNCATELGVSLPTIYRWMRLYSMDDRLTTLLPQKPDGGRGKSRLSAERERVIKIAIDKHLTPQQVTAQATVREVRRLARAANVAPPSPTTIRSRIGAIPEKTRLMMRGHKKDAFGSIQAATWKI